MGVDGVGTGPGQGGSELGLVRARGLSPYLELAAALAAGGLWYLQGGATWYAGPLPGPLPLLLLVAAWAVRLARLRHRPRPTIFDVALWGFVATAALGVWAAYDRGPAWAKFWLIIGACGIWYGVAHQPNRQHVYVALGLFAALGASVALYFLATNDWSAMAAKAPALVSAGDRLSAWLPTPLGHRMHPNVVAGFLVVLLPLCLPLVGLLRGAPDPNLPKPFQRTMGLAGIVCFAVIGAGLVFSLSRGAWLATVSAAVSWGLWLMAGRIVRRSKRDGEPAWRTRVAISAGALAVAGLLAVGGALLILRGVLPGTETANSRLSLLQNSLLLAGDYALTGAGLGMYPLQYSIYTMLIHVPHTPHSHNMLLDIAIDQGVLGLGAFIAMVGAIVGRGLRACRKLGGRQATIIEAGLASLVALIVHGAVNDLYSARSVLLMFLPFGVIMAGAGTASPEAAAESRASRQHRWKPALLALTVALALTIIAGWRPLLAAAYANLGALTQARIELGAYDPDQSLLLTMDEVRRQEDLDPALSLLRRAVAIEPGNRTARQRLAAIALSRAQYGEGLQQIEAAWEAGRRDDVTRLLLGDALVAAGRTARAAEVVRGLEWAERRLLGNAWYRYWVAEDYGRAATSLSTVLLLDPDNEAAADLLARAEANLAD